MRRATAALTALVGVLAGVASGLGVFARGDGAFVTVVSARGEVHDVAADGIYVNAARQLVAEGIGWDVFTLVVAVPLLLVGAALVGRGSFRGSLLAAGMLGYSLYLYLEYAVTWPFGPLFPLFVGLAAASLVALVGVAIALAAARGPRFDSGFPRRAWAFLSVGMAVLLAVLWTGRIVEGLGAEVPVLHGDTTMTVQALDLILIVPTSVVLGLLALRGIPGALTASAAFAVMFVTMSAAIASMMVSAAVVTGVIALPPIVVFAAASAFGLVLVFRMFASVRQTSAPDMPPEWSLGARPTTATG